MRVLVLGGCGFIGRHVAEALLRRGHAVRIGTRSPRRRLPGQRRVHFPRLTAAEAWTQHLDHIDVVVNAVGILRERWGESYAVVHHLAPAALARACAARGIRLIHVSALGLHAAARSRFITTKLEGEHAIRESGADYCIVRPSLLDGADGFGARWLRWLARSPVLAVPADARGRIAALDVDDLAEAIGGLCERATFEAEREVELGGAISYTMPEYLMALRPAHAGRPSCVLRVPAWLARLCSHVCDLLHFSPFSYGHLELMRRDNCPRANALPALLGRPPAAISRTLASRMHARHSPC